MGRYRAPRAPSSNYITPAGYDRMRSELDYLWRTKRPEVTQAVSDAAALGDRSENAEYIYGKKQLREIDSRVRYLSRRIEDAIVVRELPEDQSKVYFGAWVELESESGQLSRYRVVGADETDAQKGYISVDSPISKQLLGKSEGDLIETDQEYEIVAIYYADSDEM